jgi:hypothetical protein
MLKILSQEGEELLETEPERVPSEGERIRIRSVDLDSSENPVDIEAIVESVKTTYRYVGDMSQEDYHVTVNVVAD